MDHSNPYLSQSVWNQMDMISSMIYYEHEELDYMPGGYDFDPGDEPGHITFTLPSGDILEFHLYLA